MILARAITPGAPDKMAGRVAAGGALLLALLAAASAPAQESDAQHVNTSYGYSNFGELKYGPDEPFSYVNPDAPKGGEMSTWSIGTFDSFNQYTRKGVPAALNTIGSETLLTSAADDPYGAYCYLCTTIEWPDDKSWVIFNLRDDVTFQDGTPMTADDIAFTHALFLEQGIAEYRRLVENMYGEVEVLGPHRIKFNFQPDAPLRDRIFFAGITPAFSKAWFEENDIRLDDSTDAPFMSTGAYMLGDFDYNRRVVYRRDPDWWGADLPLNRGRNNFDTIRVEYFADTSAALEAFKSGEYLFRAEDDPQAWETGYSFRSMDQGFVTREEVPDGTVAQRLAWVFNLDREKWQDVRVREAIGMMFNFAWSNQTLYFGDYRQPASFWSNTDLAATGAPSEGEAALLQPLVDDGLLDASILTDEVAAPVEHSAESNRPSRRILRAAAALLDEAGWVTGEDGLRRKDGEMLTLTHLQYNPNFDKLVNPFIENLALLGIRARLERVDTSQYVERRRAGNFDLTSHGIQMDFEPSIALAQWFASSTADDSSRNLMRLRDPAVDRLIEPVATATTLDDLRTSVHAFDRVLRSVHFDVPIYYNPVTFVAYYDVYQHPDPLPPLALGQLDFWWYDAERAEELRAAGAI